MVFIDFDGVILDTEILLFKEWRKNPNRFSLPEEEKIKYIQKANWNYIINNSKVINDSLYYLKQTNSKDAAILTKIHSVENEGYAKIQWLRNNNVNLPVFLVPYVCKKTDIVNANGNILIDDSLKNLDDWTNNNGTGIFFDVDNDNIDTWHMYNEQGYEKVLSLSKIKHYK